MKFSGLAIFLFQTILFIIANAQHSMPHDFWHIISIMYLYL